MYTFISFVIAIIIIIYIIKIVMTKNVKRWSIKGVLGGSKKYCLIAIILLSMIVAPFAPKQNKNINKPQDTKDDFSKNTSSKEKIKDSKKEVESNKSNNKKDNNKNTNNIVKKNKEDVSNKDKNHDLTNIAAKTFGTVPVDRLQKNVGIAYSSIQLSPNQMAYGYETNITGNKQSLIRVDDTQNKITNVYLYDKNSPDFRNQTPLYTGQTIQSKPKNTYVIY